MPSDLQICDLSAELSALAADLCRQAPELAHIDTKMILFALSRSRAGGTHGTYARIAPLRFAAGAPEMTRRRGRYLETFRMPSLTHQGERILYIVYVMVPRFLRLSFEQKLATIIHELYHVSERCDGDIRRFPGRNFAHGASRQGFNRRIDAIRAAYLATTPDPARLTFLHLTEEEWAQGRLRLTGLTIPLPRARLVQRQS